VRGLWARRSKLNLVGAHINVFTGEWTQKVQSICYLLKYSYRYTYSHICVCNDIVLFVLWHYFLFLRAIFLK